MHPFAFKVARRLACQLAPAVAVAAMVVVALGDRAEPPARTAAPALPAAAEMVIEVIRDERLGPTIAAAAPVAQPEPIAQQRPRPEGVKVAPKVAPKVAATVAVRITTDDRRATTDAMRAVEPLAPPQSLAPPASPPVHEHVVVSTLRDTATTVRRIPARIGAAMAGWFEEAAPPRPPTEVPAGHFVNAAM